MFFKNNSRFTTQESSYSAASHLKTLDDNTFNSKAYSGTTMQPSLYPPNGNSCAPKRDKTPPGIRQPEWKKGENYERKKRSDMSLESPERYNNGEEDEESLRAELRDTKSKMKAITVKMSTMRKERDQLQKDNKTLQEEVLLLQASLRQMIPGFANTGGSFPMINELIGNIAEFYKCECEDLFFDLLCPELSMKGIIFFFQTAFVRLIGIVEGYFRPSEDLLKKTACMRTLEGPLMNALRKGYQSTWQDINERCFTAKIINEVARELQTHLKFGVDVIEQLESFLQKMSELVLCFYISDPSLAVNCDSIGDKVTFNPIKHEALDGFIKGKEECIVVLPSVHKNNVDGELVAKAKVLSVGYELMN